MEKTGAQFGKNDQSNSGSYRKPGYVYGKVLRHEAEVRSVSPPPCTPKPERDILVTGKNEIMKLFYQPLYTPVESYS